VSNLGKTYHRWSVGLPRRCERCGITYDGSGNRPVWRDRDGRFLQEAAGQPIPECAGRGERDSDARAEGMRA
jgi:hypothetical protein